MAHDDVLHALRAKTEPLTVDDVKRLHNEHLSRFRTASLARQATRTEVQAILELQSPPPGPDTVTDEHRIASDKARATDPLHVDAAHWVQKTHQKGLWRQTDSLVQDALGDET